MIRVRTFLVALAVIASVGLVVPAGTATAAECTFPVTSTDATGTSVTVQEEPERVVTLNPSAAQTMWEIGAEGKVVGLSGFASYLEGADDRTNVYPTSASGVNAEAVVDLTPDLVLAPNTISDDTVEQLRSAGLTVYKFEWATDAAFIVNKTRLTGRLVGECDGAGARADQMQEELDTIREATGDVDRPRVFYTFFGFTAGEGTFIDTIITTAGGENVAAEAGISGYHQYSEEIVVANDPEWIVLNSDDPNVPDTAAFDGTTAEEEGNNVTVDANYVSQPAPGIVQPMLTVVRALHPDAYETAKQGVERVRDEEGPERPPPSFSITSASVNANRVELHDTAAITVEVTNDGGPGTFEASLYLDGSLKDTRYTEIDGGETATIRLEHTFGSWGRHVLRVDDREVGTVTVVKELDEGTNATDAADATVTNATETTTPNATATPTSTTPADGTPAWEATTSGPGTRATSNEGTSPAATRVDTSTPGAPTTRAGGQSGFGPGLAVSAVVLAGLLGRRRR